MLKAETKADISNAKDIVTKADLTAAMAKQEAKMERLFRQQLMWIIGTAIAIVSINKLL